MKKVIALVLCLVMMLAVASAGAETVLKLSEVHAEGYPTALADHEFARLVEEKTEGRIKIEVFTGGTMYGQETESIEAMQLGDLAFARVSASPVASYVPVINAIQMPYLYKSGEHMWKVLNGEIGQKLLADIEASGSGLVGLCYYDGGSRSFYLTKAVHTVADMAGLKIRMQNNEMMVKMVEALGATGVTGIGPNDVYSSISTKIIDG
ncbi:MAG: TRAP transporter substrate-binding protein DctP, partial [Clostridia bacterium]